MDPTQVGRSLSEAVRVPYTYASFRLPIRPVLPRRRLGNFVSSYSRCFALWHSARRLYA